ncbi:MAG: Asp/Glu/hydantoin racemase [Candidatus Dactylopiibacterium carminicum]|uniref:Asp/Glu/hydantoin racemase n=1 Tax=Candidatus Dactylopiibacterium carminicum TaxID=857335 RepID=A0A272EVP0_9RHOO|nr:Asp/Glu/hydantoin racemase [Candidatus Dactylopiibacterium carminicum]KAF7599887.1 Asp/Glu/hydantoin racemase [Candidatus Dactylopiibacterium carminicum]PAS94174.1 MAG: Asp/Glu/hydantoin racemase [Candidatus Dactylopiibacterium carminicum]PAS99887.1 MAG: Asp/Glu/hydantoin racemase [Candidatus Dactylopiibacterium carminicum]
MKRIRLGILTPSSNTSLEPLTCGMLQQLPGVSAHFSRFTVTRIALDDGALGQFDDGKILAAARLLADARVDMIGWSGTAAGWLGFDSDRLLRARITEATGIPATSSILALNELLALRGFTRMAIVSPYLEDVQRRIAANYAAAGIGVVAESHLSISENFAFAEVDEATLDAQVAQVARAAPQVVVPYCTNLYSAHFAQRWEKQYGCAVYDTTSTVVWKMLRACGVDTARIEGWGSLMREGA